MEKVKEREIIAPHFSLCQLSKIIRITMVVLGFGFGFDKAKGEGCLFSAKSTIVVVVVVEHTQRDQGKHTQNNIVGFLCLSKAALAGLQQERERETDCRLLSAVHLFPVVAHTADN